MNSLSLILIAVPLLGTLGVLLALEYSSRADRQAKSAEFQNGRRRH